MTKNIKDQARHSKTTKTERQVIPPKYQHPAAMIFIYICLLVFFHAITFEGKTYQSADTIASHSWDTFLKDAQAEGITPLWNPYIFCGMPGYASLTYSVPRTFDIISTVTDNARSLAAYIFIDKESGGQLLFYLIYGIGIYLFVFYRLKNKSIALIVSLMATYATYVAVLIMIGHITKIAVLAWFPYTFLLVEKLREKFNLLHGILLAIIVRLMIEPGHVQFIFYIYLSLGTYLLFLLIRSFIKKENWRGILISGITLLAATTLAVLTRADIYLSTLEYNPYSIRGSNPIVHTTPTQQTKTIEGGLDYDYATSWSFSPGEMMTFLVPSWYGFGWHPYQGPLTQNRETRLNTYWGPQPFVDGPQYMGIVVMILAIVGFIRNRKDSFVQFMGVSIIISLLVAFGKEFSLVYDLMYKYFPLFNKFRLPLLVLMLVQFFIPILAGYGILSFITVTRKNLSPAQEKRWKYLLGSLVIGVFAVLVGKNFIKEIYTSIFPLQQVGITLAQSYGQNRNVLELLYDFVFSCVITDLLVGFILLITMFGALYFYQKGKLKAASLFGILIIIVLFDLWRVASKPADLKDKREGIKEMPTPEFAKVLQQDTTQFRAIKMVNGQPVYDNSLAFWRIQNAYGYHGAKMRIYQDMVDVAGLGNPLVWQLMNIKYFVTNRDETNPEFIRLYNGQDMKVYAFRSWLPRVFYVNKYEVSDGLNTLKKIAALSFDPRDIAYVFEKIKMNIDPPLPGAEATIVHYGIQDLEVQATATGNNLLFLSEAYYPKGWKAYIDGKEVDILRLNYLFRGVIIPKGEHILKMKFEPESFFLGKNLSLIMNVFVIGIFLIFSFILYRNKQAGLKMQNTRVHNMHGSEER